MSNDETQAGGQAEAQQGQQVVQVQVRDEDAIALYANFWQIGEP